MNKIAYFEVCQKVNSTLSTDNVRAMIKSIIERSNCIPLGKNLMNCEEWTVNRGALEELAEHIDSFVCTINESETRSVKIALYKIWKICVYSLSREGTATETMQHDSEELSVASHIILPALDYEGLWESLYYEANIKDNLAALEWVTPSIGRNILRLASQRLPRILGP